MIRQGNVSREGVGDHFLPGAGAHQQSVQLGWMIKAQTHPAKLPVCDHCLHPLLRHISHHYPLTPQLPVPLK